MTDAEKLELLRKRHYRTAEDWGSETIDICGECSNDWPCLTIQIIES